MFPLILNLVTRRIWVVTFTPMPLGPRKIHGASWIGGWVGPRTLWSFWQWQNSLAPTEIRIPYRPVRS
jgi:hypothetical protein